MSSTIHVNKLRIVTCILRLLTASAIVELLERDCVAFTVLSVELWFLTVYILEFCEVSFEQSES